MLRLLTTSLLIIPVALGAQQKLPDITGTWVAQTPDGPREVIVRPDSSASFGDETVRWRLERDSLHIAFGDEWTVYAYRLKKNKLTLDGGDLEEPVTLVRKGPATPRPAGVPIPPAPPADRRAAAGLE